MSRGSRAASSECVESTPSTSSAESSTPESTTNTHAEDSEFATKSNLATKTRNGLATSDMPCPAKGLTNMREDRTTCIDPTPDSSSTTLKHRVRPVQPDLPASTVRHKRVQAQDTAVARARGCRLGRFPLDAFRSTCRALCKPLDFRLVTLLCLVVATAARSEVCWDKFDLNYRNQCLNGAWEQRYYFDHASLTCRQFWFDGCRADSRNIFEDQLTCQWLCESQPMYKSRSCLEDFDEGLKKECNGGRWRQQWYFDKQSKKCHAFWYDGCKGENENMFPDELSCLHTCENPAKKDPRKPWGNNDKFKMKEILGDVYKPNVTDVCAVKNPCKNNGTCIFVWKKNTHFCKCPPPFHGNSCEKKIEKDPCAGNPCQNGATCQAKLDEDDKPTFDCYCTAGYGGPKCDQKPCDVNPCLNNGTCRTTRGLSTYFCECQQGFGGKNCDIAIGSKRPEETFGKNVEQISSGKEEWIAQMRERLKEASGGIGGATGAGLATIGPKKDQGSGEKSNKVAKSATAAVADEPYKDPATKKREREELAKKEAEEKAKLEEAAQEKARIEEIEKQMEEQRRLEQEELLDKSSPTLWPAFAALVLVRILL